MNAEMMEEKIKGITNCLDQRDVDLWQLRELAISEGGLINRTLRGQAWPKLVGVNVNCIVANNPISDSKRCNDTSSITYESQNSQSKNFDNSCKREQELTMIEQDLGRTVFVRYFPNTDNYNSIQKDMIEAQPQCNLEHKSKKNHQNDEMQKLISDLSIVLKSVTSTSSEPDFHHYHYYQGYHDIAAMFLYNLPKHAPEIVSNILLKVSESHFKDAMHEDFSKLTMLLKITFYPLLFEIDSDIHDSLFETDLNETIIFPWIISWFAHDLHDVELSSRLFDFFLVSHQLMPLYFALAIIVHKKNRNYILETEEDSISMHIAISHLISKISSKRKQFDSTLTDKCKNENDDFIDHKDNAQPVPSLESISPSATEENNNKLVVNTKGSSCDHNNSTHGYNNYQNMDDKMDIQDLIDSAIKIMKKHPPGSLVSLSKRYHRDNGLEQPTLKNIMSIEMLKAAPNWSLTSTAQADWVLRQRRRGKLKKYSSPSLSTSSKMEKHKSGSSLSKSMIACGLAPMRDFTMEEATKKGKKFSSSFLMKSVMNSKSNLFDAYKHITTMLVQGRRKRIFK